ncbi:neutral alpha-glucosidase C-like [Ascaphus truei]|uniref:neutral alpha-glucosidase C-like n=1 Tax=Ascaphus truei TaxID=8439 RepID=UPI003F5972D4
MFSYRRLTFHKNRLSSRSADRSGQYHAESVLEKVLIMGVKKRPCDVTAHTAGADEESVPFRYNHKLGLLTLEGLSFGVSADWEIHITNRS